jgi:hypothetical protein
MTIPAANVGELSDTGSDAANSRAMASMTPQPRPIPGARPSAGGGTYMKDFSNNPQFRRVS